MLSFVSKYGSDTHSQNREDGVTAECLRRMGINHGHSVEIGGNDGRWMSNTRLLLENGWAGLFVESDWRLYQECKKNWAHNPSVRVQCSHVDGNNINAFVDDSCDVLSTDTDGADYEIFKGLKAKPRIVIVEIDSSTPPGDEGFNSDGGAGYRSMVALGVSKGYRLLCHTGNLVFINKQYESLFPEIKDHHPLTDADLYFNRAWLKEEAA